jgi:uncharacterized protein YceH (UPF0502 family)
MSTDPIAQPDPLPSWPVLSVNERRVLGVLVEKAKTTPDAYPLTLNALTTGCNQKSNRDPLLELNDLDVEEALADCQKKALVFKITGSRVDRWKHNLYDAWQLNKVELAILGELLLRGAQTEGELRARASRMEPIADLDALRETLKPLASRGLVVYLTSEGRRGTTLTHRMQSPAELQQLRASHVAGPASASVSSPVATGQTDTGVSSPSSPATQSALEGQITALHAELAKVRGQVTELQAAVASLSSELRGLKDALGT